MTLIVDQYGPKADGDAASDADDDRRRIDVTDLHAAGIEGFVESSVGTDRVSLEHRGGRTYLVVEE